MSKKSSARSAYTPWDGSCTKCSRCRKNVDYGNGAILDYSSVEFSARVCWTCYQIHVNVDLIQDPGAFGQVPAPAQPELFPKEVPCPPDSAKAT